MTKDDSLFTISENHLDTGLRGIPVGTCLTSYVDPIEGVHYVGYPVGDLADLEEEDVIYGVNAFRLWGKRLLCWRRMEEEWFMG